MCSALHYLPSSFDLLFLVVLFFLDLGLDLGLDLLDVGEKLIKEAAAGDHLPLLLEDLDLLWWFVLFFCFFLVSLLPKAKCFFNLSIGDCMSS